jgi:hypothetical protein
MSNKIIDDTDETMIDAEYIPNNSVSEEQIEEATEMLVENDNEETIIKPKFRPATINELNVNSLHSCFYTILNIIFPN